MSENPKIDLNQLVNEVRAMFDFLDFLREKKLISPDIQQFAVQFANAWGDIEVEVEVPADIIAQIRQSQS